MLVMVKTSGMSKEQLTQLQDKYKTFTYDQKYGPFIPDEIAELERRANCQRYVRDAIHASFGVLLPSTYLSKEIFEYQQGLFLPIEFGDEQFGDIFLLGRPSDTLDVRSLHLTFFEGEYHDDNKNNPLLRHFHGNAKTKGLKYYPLSVFQDAIHAKDYGMLYGIRRIVPENISKISIEELNSVAEVETYDWNKLNGDER
jgi:hypothetical protein